MRIGSIKLRLASGCVLATALTGCGSMGPAFGTEVAQVRFVAVATGTPEVDLAINGAGAAYGLGFESFTSYLPVSSGAVTLSAARAGSGAALASTQGLLSPGRQYTAVLGHAPGSGLREQIYPDQEQPAPAGQLSLRIVNEIQAAAPVTFYIEPVSGERETAPATVVPLGFTQASAYANVAAGSYLVTATAAERGINVPLGSGTVKAGTGAVRTIVFAGTAAPTGKAHVVSFILQDADAP